MEHSYQRVRHLLCTRIRLLDPGHRSDGLTGGGNQTILFVLHDRKPLFSFLNAFPYGTVQPAEEDVQLVPLVGVGHDDHFPRFDTGSGALLEEEGFDDSILLVSVPVDDLVLSQLHSVRPGRGEEDLLGLHRRLVRL